MKEQRTHCTACGAWEAPGLYHPHTFCVLVNYYRGDVGAARMALDAVLDWGRRLERHGLPNSARIATVSNADAPTKQKRAPQKKHAGR